MAASPSFEAADLQRGKVCFVDHAGDVNGVAKAEPVLGQDLRSLELRFEQQVGQHQRGGLVAGRSAGWQRS